MANEKYPNSQIPIRKTAELLPRLFQSESNKKFMSGTVDPLVQPGTLEKTVGYIGRRYGKTYSGQDIYLDTDNTLRSRYQLEPGVVVRNNDSIAEFYDYLDFKNQLKFFNNKIERDDLITGQDHYTWNPPIDWDKFVNYREYFWIPEGPLPIDVFGKLGQSVRANQIIEGNNYKIETLGDTDFIAIGADSNEVGTVFFSTGNGVGSGTASLLASSTYSVRTSVNSYIFNPDGLTNNPTLTLYRGLTYKFKVNVPGDAFFIRQSLDTGSNQYNPILPYAKNQIVVYGDKVYKAKENIPSQANPILVDEDIRWEEITSVEQNTFLDYTAGVENNGIENGTVTFTVPFDGPDILYYQSFADLNKFGKFIVKSIDSNTFIDVETELLGKSEFTSGNGIVLTNGMVVNFIGQVEPSEYSNDTWVVEGVGESITLTNFNDLIVPTSISIDTPEILFDNEGFDTLPFDDAAAYPSRKDYVTITKSSKDGNPWSRYNRWFHKSVLEQAYNNTQTSFDFLEEARAKRPIIEFNSNIQLFNHGSVLKKTIDYYDNSTKDAFSIIEGSKGYIVDGESLFDGARILFAADTDSLVKNKIYQVKFITHNNRKQISLIETEDTNPLDGEGVLVRRGTNNAGLMYHYDGESWIKSQEKTTVNQPPLFDIFDNENVSFSDQAKYPVSSFLGSKILSYRSGNGVTDSELGFSLSYLNINNIGDIQFNFDLESQTFTYQDNQSVISKNISTGFYKLNPDTLENGWIKVDHDYSQPIIDSIVIEQQTNTLSLTTLNWKNVSDSDIRKIIFYLNGIQIKDSYTRNQGIFVFSRNFEAGDVISIKIFADAEPNTGYYEIPLGLEKNPLNQKIESFTLGQASDHILSGLELSEDFVGSYPGSNNLRDISGYNNLTKKFLKHAGLTPLSMLLLCDKEVNIIKSIQYAKESYTEFKNNFIKLSTVVPYVDNIPNFVDSILIEMSKSKNSSNAFFGSDMAGSGAYSELVYQVEDEGITTFVLSEKFDLENLSNKSVYVYVNSQQLLHGRDYNFNSDFGFVNLTVELKENDIITIREYVSTANSFIPSTPTKLGLYKKYTPEKFFDDTYIIPRNVIQGHDGSLTTCYNDFRDELLLELEYRIYNNLKQEYDTDIFDIDSVLGGYYGSGEYSKEDLDSVIAEDFLKWVSKVNTDYLDNSYFDTENPFTYVYTNMTDPSGEQNLPGWWRGVYQWFYDTDRPHRCPWEMLGFSQMPLWWESEYGPSPYTKNNLILWEDLSNGIIRQGDRAGTFDRYKRPTLLKHIPVDSEGKLVNPLDSGLAGNFVLINNKGTFKFGDISPVEYAWRSSSEYPFAIISALCLLKPFDFIIKSFNKSKLQFNIIDQLISKDTEQFIDINETVLTDRIVDTLIENTTPSDELVSGSFIYLFDFVKGKRQNQTILENKINNIDVVLSSRISGFVDQEQQKYLLDSKTPSSTSSSIFIPQENYDIVFNVSTPVSSISYSGVVIEKVNTGWKISGYDVVNPYFNYFQPIVSQSDPVLTVGGVSETFLNWTPDTFYGNGVLIRINNSFYRSIRSHTSGDNFDTSLWKQLPKVPIVGAVEAQYRRNFNRLSIKTLSYSQILNSIQEVVDFLLGYGEYQKSIGILFNGYDTETQTAVDWLTSAKEFMYWSKHNWEVGSLLSLSPCAGKLEIETSVGVSDNLLDSFYSYQVYKNDGTVINPDNIDVLREFQKVTVSMSNSNDGIYFIKINFVLKEHIVLFDDRTVFNDVIYDKPTGYRQDRIKVRGFRTVDWDGDYTSPGFIFDNVSISVWQPYVDYNLGDIVAYKSFFWTSKTSHPGSENFDDSKWTKLDLIPRKGLVSNFDYRINQFEDYFDVDADGIGSSQRDLARHTLGYQKRDYLQNLAEDEVTQFRLYQGFIREKGTANSVVKVFDKLSETSDDSIVLNEEWAFKAGQFGGTDQNTEFEFKLNKDEFVLNPQPIIFQESKPNVILDQYLRITKDSFTLAPNSFNENLNPLKPYSDITRDAGYVALNQVEYVIQSREEILGFPVELVSDNEHFWITFDNLSWTVLRFNNFFELRISELAVDGDIVTLIISQDHGLSEGDIVAIKELENLSGFYQIFDVNDREFSLIRNTILPEPVLDETAVSYLGKFSDARFKDFSEIDYSVIPLLKQNSKLWVDTYDNGWAVFEKQDQYKSIEIDDIGVISAEGIGKAVVYNSDNKQIITSAPNPGYILIYKESTARGTNELTLTEIITPDSSFLSSTTNVFAEVLAISPDNKWLIAGSPRASGVKSKFKGAYDPSLGYQIKDVVLDQNGKMWEAIRTINEGDGSTINLDQLDWRPLSILEADGNGYDGFHNQGMITLYKYENRQWVIDKTIVSPRPSEQERFGSNVTIGVSGTTYFMAVSAEGSLSAAGRVYLFQFNGEEWINLDNSNYLGVYSDSSSVRYPAGSIVWHKNKLWTSLSESVGGDEIENSPSWNQIEDIPVQNILPSNPALIDDGSTLPEGLIGENSLTEIVKAGDAYGFSISMNRDASYLAIGSPNSDGQYYSTYKGIWNSYQVYNELDVVRYQGLYYQLTATTSENQIPLAGSSWILLQPDGLKEKSGKVFIYKKNLENRYTLIQKINSNNLSEFSNIETEIFDSGDYFGYSLDFDWSGNTLVVSAPQADVNMQEQGSVYVFNLINGQYRLIQKLDSFENNINEMFGSSVSISSGSEQIVVGAKNSSVSLTTIFDRGLTIFDANTTGFFESLDFSGQAYIFENQISGYYLTEKLQPEILGESFGSTVDSKNNLILVGSPTHRNIGTVRLYKKDNDASGLNIIEKETDLVDTQSVNGIILFDDEKNLKLADVDCVDYYKFKILGPAESELSFKTIYDPAIYMLGTSEQIIDEEIAWFDKNIGKLWWDLSSIKFINYEQGEFSYKIGNWNRFAEGSSVDVYEWVETVLLPSEWSLLADTTEGLNSGISGQPKHPDDTVYNSKTKFNPATGEESGTLYYYWVKSSTIIPPNNLARRISCASVIGLIENPITSNLPFVAIIDTNKFLAYNLKNYFESDTALLNFRYKKTNNINNIHTEYQLLTEGVDDSLPSASLETKWIDSLIGSDVSGNRVPDLNLPIKQRYGVDFRPRQTMFVNRFEALKIVVNNVNNILKQRPFADVIDFKKLNSVDTPPIEGLNQYDLTVDNFIDLDNISTFRLRQAILSPNIINGQLSSIDIVDSGLGYKTPPSIDIEGDGENAKAIATIDTQGRINSVTVIRNGRRYSTLNIKVRSFSVLVRYDSTFENNWSIYSWDQRRRVFYRQKSQAYNVTKFWNYTDWWKPGYSESSRIVEEISNLYEESAINLLEGDLLKVKEFANGGWAIFERTIDNQGDVLNNYNLVGRQQGTLKLSAAIYDVNLTGIGYNGASSYDSVFYDLQNAKEVRLILEAVKQDILTEDLRVEWNKLFFNSVRYAFSEQLYVDWAFKTSFLSAIHNVGEFKQKVNYKNDSLDSYKQYLEEVKPYRTTIREYTSRYTRLENTPTAISDFDLPPAYSEEDGQILPINSYYDRTDEYPWKWWKDNNGFSITSINLYDQGSGYIIAPEVLIDGNGRDAVARAFIANGKVIQIKIISGGTGYTEIPKITLVGGNSDSLNTAKAVAVIGDSVVRTFDISIKFDRITKEGLYQTFTKEQTFTATNASTVFDLNYAPNANKNTIQVFKNNQILLNNEYEISIFEEIVNSTTILKGKLILNNFLSTGDTVKIIYEINDQYLDSVDRINKYYNPTSGMIGKEISQLMTGVDFGGVQIQGTTFDITGGWDALPWASDNWDSVESNNDFYFAFTAPNYELDKIYNAGSSVVFEDAIYKLEGVGPSTSEDIPGESGSRWQLQQLESVELPFTPEVNQAISIYLKRNQESEIVRIDDLNYPATPSNTNAVMPTFIGDGSTAVIQIDTYITISPGDTLIFRTDESDGTVAISDINLLDTSIDGGSLSSINNAYVDATGIRAEEISIEGDTFISPDQVPAPEEVVPGQVLDSLSIKVYNSVLSGATPIHSSVYIGDISTRFYDIGLTVFESRSVLVYVDKIRQLIDTDYTLNFFTNQVEFNDAPSDSSIIEIISVGIGGNVLIDYQEFLADGETSLFLTDAIFQQTGSVLASINGNFVDVEFFNSSTVIDTENKTMIQFGFVPEINQRIKIICIGNEIINQLDAGSFIRVNEQHFVFDGSTYSFELDNFVNFENSSAEMSVLVDVNNKQLNGVDVIYNQYDGVINEFVLGVDPEELPGTITTENIKVFVNDNLKEFITDYTFDITNKKLILVEENLSVGDVIRIEVNVKTEYSVENNVITISTDAVDSIGDKIVVKWFSNYPAMKIISDQYQGGKVRYKLSRIPLSSDYVWIYKNGIRLTNKNDFEVLLFDGTVRLKEDSSIDDVIKIVEFAGDIYQAPVVYEIYKDMLNNNHYKRFDESPNIRLTKPLHYYDKTMTVSDATTLFDPVPSKNLPGVVFVNNERIEYFTKNGNVLGQLRRGYLGTGILEIYSEGSLVVNVGPSETIPYRESQIQEDFASDGSSLLIGPLNFVPTKTEVENWFRDSIPDNFGLCNELEVFVSGTRLRKNSIYVYDEQLGPNETDAGINIQADFSVDGITPYIRLTQSYPAGTHISVIRKQGTIWYNRGESTASAGVTFLQNDNKIINFISEKGSDLTE